MPDSRGSRSYSYLVILSFLFLLAGCTATQLKNRPPELFKDFKHYERIHVSAIRPPWTNTDAFVQEDEDIIVILASGTAITNKRTGEKVPPWKGLYYNIGEDAMFLSAFWSGYDQTSKPALSSGRLKFAVRDWRAGGNFSQDWYNDNLGGYLVDVFVISKDKEHMIPVLLKEIAKANPEDQAFVANVAQLTERKAWYFSAVETTQKISKTRKEIESLTEKIKVGEQKKPQAPATSGDHAENTHVAASVAKPEAARPKESLAKPIAQTEADLELKVKLNDLMLQLESLEKIKKNYEEKMESREKELLAKLELANQRAPIAFIGSPHSGANLEIGTVIFSGVVEDDVALTSIDLLHNGKVMADALDRGVAATAKEKQKRFEFRKKVNLVKGENTLQVKVTDSDGLTTIKAVKVHYVESRKNIWAAVIGIDNYLNVRHLQYASKDARAFYDYLVKRIHVPESNITLLVNQDANLTKIRSVLGTRLKRKAGKSDMVLIYFAGHGATEKDSMSPDGDGLEKYILPYDADPADLYASALPMSEVSKIFQRIQSERLIFIADACYSGASGGRTIGFGGMRSSISDAFLDRIVRGKGRVIITASGSNEVSAENDMLKHGVFTYYLLEGLYGKADLDRDGIITVDEAYDYVSRNVPLATEQNQHPVKKGSVEGQLVMGIAE